MKYVLLIHDEEKVWESMQPAEYKSMHDEYMRYTQELRESGRYRAGEALQPVATATTVRVRGGQIQTTDGPFAETREQLGGFYLVDAENLDEAIALAARIPSARIGSIEVRPCIVFPDAPPPDFDPRESYQQATSST
jgi:hypothetical protein